MAIIDGCQPTLSDDRDECVAFADLFGKEFHEVDARLDVVDVEEDLFPTQSARNAIINSTGIASGVLAPVTNEDAAQDTGLRARRLRRIVGGYAEPGFEGAQALLGEPNLDGPVAAGRRDGE